MGTEWEALDTIVLLDANSRTSGGVNGKQRTRKMAGTHDFFNAIPI